MKNSVQFAYAVAGVNGVEVISKLDPASLPSNIKADSINGGYITTPVDLNPDGSIPIGAAIPMMAILVPDGFVAADAQWDQQVKAKVAEPSRTLAWNLRAGNAFDEAARKVRTTTMVEQQAIQANAQLVASSGRPALDSSLVA